MHVMLTYPFSVHPCIYIKRKLFFHHLQTQLLQPDRNPFYLLFHFVSKYHHRPLLLLLLYFKANQRKMVTVSEIRQAQRAEGPATILAIGTATPPNCVDQSTYPDYYFRITNSEHMTDLKEKFQRMCDKSMIKKRYMHVTEEVLKENPNMCAYCCKILL
ncbi:hypothetical protein VIGAN_10234200 [Vigna angularis var. angularis]|uniref:Chalcone/stilbene synthase N-terminal domain-containing protein n=1 Tax=Vigna angularis var. angularis TaxID=157739 RepID=A0A0S3T723_PHAAN|nr:hypothetical protein VIGAN_10234200 [Vigna angularis var. angularis]